MCEGTGADSILRSVAEDVHAPSVSLGIQAYFAAFSYATTTTARIPLYRTDHFKSHSLWTLSTLHGHSVQRGRAFFSSMLLRATKTVRFIRHGEPRTATSTFTHLLTSVGELRRLSVRFVTSKTKLSNNTNGAIKKNHNR